MLPLHDWVIKFNNNELIWSLSSFLVLCYLDSNIHLQSSWSDFWCRHTFSCMASWSYFNQNSKETLIRMFLQLFLNKNVSMISKPLYHFIFRNIIFFHHPSVCFLAADYPCLSHCIMEVKPFLQPLDNC